MLKRYGHLDMTEQMYMTAEERKWWIQRIDDENRKQNQANSHQAPSASPSPGRPPV